MSNQKFDLKKILANIAEGKEKSKKMKTAKFDKVY